MDVLTGVGFIFIFVLVLATVNLLVGVVRRHPVGDLGAGPLVKFDQRTIEPDPPNQLVGIEVLVASALEGVPTANGRLVDRFGEMATRAPDPVPPGFNALPTATADGLRQRLDQLDEAFRLEPLQLEIHDGSEPPNSSSKPSSPSPTPPEPPKENP